MKRHLSNDRINTAGRQLRKTTTSLDSDFARRQLRETTTTPGNDSPKQPPLERQPCEGPRRKTIASRGRSCETTSLQHENPLQQQPCEKHLESQFTWLGNDLLGHNRVKNTLETSVCRGNLQLWNSRDMNTIHGEGSCPRRRLGGRWQSESACRQCTRNRNETSR